MNHSLKTRVLCMLLTLAMVLSILPMAAFATEITEPAPSEPVIIEPAPSEPVVDEPAPSEPVIGEPAPSEPVVDEPAPSEPMTDEPAPSDPATSEETEEVVDTEIQKTELSEETDEAAKTVKASGGFPSADLDVSVDKKSALAPGVTLNTITAYNNKDEQVKMWVTKADMSVDTVKLFASYKNMDPTNYGMSKLTEQVASFNKKAAADDAYYQGTVVAGINASYYNMQNGKPTGTFVMNGIDVTTESEGNAYGYFAVMKDGSVKIGNKNDYSKDKGNIQEAIGIYTMLIVDGEICSGLNTTQYYPRQTIGITADGDVILMTADGNQAPKSVGLTVLEQAQVMKDLGCVWAGHLDGGGSCTYASKAEGSNAFKITNSPSDGSERSISNGFIIVSTAVSDGKFKSAALIAENEYVTPNTVVNISATGVDQGGGPAEIPADISWKLEDSSFGTVADGVFTSTGKTGAAVVQMVYNGDVVGETTVNVVIPDAVRFGSEAMTVPFSKTVDLRVSATYGVKDVAIKPADFKFELSEAIGTIDGFNFTAPEDSEKTEAVLTATLVYDETIKATSKLILGKGSEIVYDFEDGTTQGVVIDETPGTAYNYTWPEISDFQVYTAQNGQVRNGSYALGATVDYSNSLESGYMKTSIYAKEQKVFKNATKVGIWMYIPDEMVGLWARWTLQPATVKEDGTVTFSGNINSNSMDTGDGGTGYSYTFEEPGWHYLWADVSSYEAVGWKANSAMIQLYISDRDGSAYNYIAANQSNIPAKYRVYIDDITVDYSSAVDDREAPVVKNLTYAAPGMPDAAALNNQTVSSGNITFAANIADYEKENASGVDATSVKVYIDGVEVEATYANNIVSVDAALTNGKHTIKFSACDNMGNYGCKYGYITVNAAESDSTVKLVPHDPTADRIKLGSIYEMDLVATAIEEVQSVVVDIDLDNNSIWQLAHMTVAEGFTATYSVGDEENVATIKITRTGTNTQTGEAALATLPVRVWTLKTGYTYPNGTKKGAAAYTLAQFKNMKEFWKMSVIAEVDKGVLTRVDNSKDTFTGERVFCDTEMWFTATKMDATSGAAAYYNTWDGGHVHNAAPVADKAATCTEDGLVGQTFCQGCNSVVEWGTVIPAAHNYTVVDGVLKCSCGELFNGTHTDGKIYIDGVVVDGWNGESYYRDGEMLTGLQEIDGIYYDFGTDGVCPNKARLDGFYYDAVAGGYRYFTAGLLTTGEVNIYPEVYFYDANGLAISGKVDVLGYTCYFTDKGAFEKSDDASVVDAGYSGTNIQYVLLKNGKLIVDGQGVMKDYTANGKYPAWIIQNDEMAITSLEVGNGITEIGRFGFYNIKHLKTLTFEENSSLKTIGWAAFGHNWRLTGVTIPASVETLETCAFYNCGAMTEVKFEEGSKLKTIKSCAFQKDIWLETVYIPDSVASIATDAFAGANADVVLQVAKNSVGHTFAVTKGMKYELREGVVAQIMSGNISDTVQWSLLSNGTLKITGSGAMVDYTSHTQQPWASMRDSIKTIVIGKDITTVGNYTFAYCQNTETVEFEKDSKCTTIGVLGFFNNPKLKAITLPETVTYISAYALGDCFALVDVYVPQSVSGIYKTAFTNSKNAVLNVAKGSFAESFAAMNNIAYTTRDFVYIPIASGSCGTNATWKLFENGELWIEGSGAMTNYTAHTQQPWANYRHTIKKIVIDKNITSVGNYAFAYCQNTTSVEFKENCEVTSIGILSFFNNPKLKSITLPETVTYISAYALGDCFELVDVYVPQRTSNIYKTAFTNSKKAVLNVAKGAYGETFAVANNIAHTVRDFVYAPIASGNCGENATWAMYENGELWIGGSGDMTNYSSHTQQPWATIRHTIKKVVVGKNITSIGNYAFAYCQNTTAVDFEEGSKLATVGILSFFNNPNVAKVALPETVTYIAAYAFGDCFALEECYIPAATSNIYKTAFTNSAKVVLNVASGSAGEKFAKDHGVNHITR